MVYMRAPQCSEDLPLKIWKAAKRTGAPSVSAYIRNAVIDALARDLEEDAEELRARQPKSRQEIYEIELDDVDWEVG